ncbi:cobalamin biosynthesis protein CobD/CbiB [Corynebacterium sputi]|uniref:cobalamin biosynthesis protein CobD/CbiB n=1 Tax=Corynebacterium sputi TaxID=489915 RepID=UPI0003FEBD0E|nr:CobD/CbiB family cobalamin biosynthesis protein [Corynebacterium sputi]
MHPFHQRALGLTLGFAADRVFGDPAKHHPVAWFGTCASVVERAIYSDSRSRGALYAGVLIVPVVGAGMGVGKRFPVFSLAVTTWAALGGTTLAHTGERMARRLDEARDNPSLIDAPRSLIPWLCSRDPSALGLDDMARATVESLAENTSDAVTGTLVWGAVAGTPGVLLHRCANTLDAMVGYRTVRYTNFGWASAKVDDAVNWLPARITGLATALVGPKRTEAVRAWRRDASAHPSPNAGIPEATAAGALGLQLGGVTRYAERTEHRPTMGAGRAPEVSDVRRMVRLTRRVQAVSLGLVVGALLALPR